MSTDTDILAGILAATDTDAMPRVISQFEFLGHTVSIVEPTMGGDDGIRRGYLWHAMIGGFDLEPTRPGLYDTERWVPGIARPRPDVESKLLTYSTVSPAAAARGARRILRKRTATR